MSGVRRTILAVVLGLGLAAVAGGAGCSTFQKGQSIVRYEHGAAVYSVKAPSTSDFQLYESDGVEPRMTVHVEEGRPLGFDRDPDGKLLAIAGDQKIPIAEGSYTWRRR